VRGNAREPLGGDWAFRLRRRLGYAGSMRHPVTEVLHAGDRAQLAMEAPRASLLRLVTPPPLGRGVCRCCRGFCSPGWDLCHSCTAVLSQVPFPCTSVTPISLYQIPGPLHAVLRGYKEGRPEALHHATWLGLLLAAFLRLHGSCVAGPLGWEELVVVPSTKEHRAPHPLDSTIRQAIWWEHATSGGALAGSAALPRPRVARAGPHVPAQQSPSLPGWTGSCPPGRPGSCLPGSCPPGWPALQPSARLVRSGTAVDHARPDQRAFTVVGSVAARRILLVDDTWTTGARAESAASALAGAGAVVVGIVVIGRVVEPRAGLRRRRAWREACERPFDPMHCAAEDASDR